MKFTRLRFQARQTIELPMLDAVPGDRYLVKSIDGLQPADNNRGMKNIPYLGNSYNGGRLPKKELTILVALAPDYTVGQTASDLRTELYSLLTPVYPGVKDVVDLEFLDSTGTPQYYVQGSVRRIEPAIFTKDPAVQIVFATNSPFILDIDEEFPNIGTLNKLFPTISNPGSAPTGFYMEIKFTGSLSSFTVFDEFDVRKMAITYSFIANDILMIDTREGSKSIKRNRSGTVIIINSSLSTDSDWLQLVQGTNTLHNSSNAFDWQDFRFRPAYWGA